MEDPTKTRETIIPTSELSPEEVELLESFFPKKPLPPSPIDIGKCRESIEIDSTDTEMTLEVLDSMLQACLEYTEDVALMEKFVRQHPSQFDEEREEIDNARTRKHDAMIASVNAFHRILLKEKLNTDWFNWDSNNRAKYGSFAVLLTLNRFKDTLIIKRLVHILRESGSIDFSILRSNANELELKIIEYVETLVHTFKSDTPQDSDAEDLVSEEDTRKLTQISSELGQDSNKILVAFYEIYLMRYK